MSGETASLNHGYRAFVEIGGWDNLAIVDISTTHGYQFTPNLFAGVGVCYGALIGGTFSTVYLDLRYDFNFSGVQSPYVDFRLSSENHNKGAYWFQPAIGYRYKHLNVSARYWLNGDDNFAGFSIGLDFGGRKKK